MTAGQPTVVPRAGTQTVSTDGASATAALAAWATGFGAEAPPHELHDVVRDRLLDFCTNVQLASRFHGLARPVPEVARTAMIEVIRRLSHGSSLSGLGEELPSAWTAT